MEPTLDNDAPTAESARHLLTTLCADLLHIPAEDIDPDADLVALGLESMGIMRVSIACRRAGHQVRFKDLVEQPTISAWTQRLEGAAAPLPEPPQPQAPSPGPAQPSPVPASSQEPAAIHEFALAPMQQAYWIGSQPGQQLGGVSAHFYVEFDGPRLDTTRLEAAIHALIARHPQLRARFGPGNCQRVSNDGAWSGLAIRDVSKLSSDDAAQQLEGIRRTEAHRRFDPAAGDLFRVAITHLCADRCRLHIGIDMLAADAQSFQVLLRDLAALYAGQSLGALEVTFEDCLREAFAADAGNSAQREAAARYWLDRLASLPPGPQLPTRVRPSLEHPGSQRHHLTLSPAHRDALTARAREYGTTLSVVLCSLYAEVLGYFSENQHFLLTLPRFNRTATHPQADLIVGDFTDITLLEVDLTQRRDFSSRIAEVKRQLHDDLAHAEFSGLDVLRELTRANPAAALRAPAVFTSVIGQGPLFDTEVVQALGEPVWTSSETPQVLVDQQVIELADGGLMINWDVTADALAEGVPDSLIATYRCALEWLCTSADWSAPLPLALSNKDQAERAQANASGPGWSGEVLHTRFFEQAAADPDRTAIITAGEATSYAELSQRSRQVAAALRDAGVRAGDRVAVSLPRGAAQAAAVLGALFIGACYVPVGLEQPGHRRARMYAASGARCVVTEIPADQIAAELRAAGHVGLSLPTLPADRIATAQPDRQMREVDPAALAYVIFTSGSTGEPKGVAVSHAAAANTVLAINARLALGPDDAVLALSALDFDLSVYDLFGLLSVGGTVVIVEDAQRKEALHWAQLLTAHRITIWNTVPALLEMLLSVLPQAPDSALRAALVSGDWVPSDLPTRFRDRFPTAKFVALGGATEAGIWSNALEVEQPDPSWQAVPYGYPLPGQCYRVVDRQGRDRPRWVPGELWIGGLGVAEGYLNDPERTVASFVEDGGQRWYRTGDLGRYLPGGMLEFLGRRDHQVKLLGHRVELGEVAAACAHHRAVERAVALVTDDRRLAVAVSTTTPDALSGQQIIATVAEQLPAHMVPVQVAVLAELPLTGNGKVDMQALAKHFTAQAHPDGADGSPAEPGLEQELAALLAQQLGIERPSRTANFFSLGGDSLKATVFLQRLRERYGDAPTLAALFAEPTVAGLARQMSILRDQHRVPMEEGAL